MENLTLFQASANPDEFTRGLRTATEAAAWPKVVGVGVRLDKRVTASQTTFVPATLTLRPPRVAIVFPDDERWRDWVMRALEVASEHWGGGGFILVPYDARTGEPSSGFAEIVRSYDPDHVVVLKIGVSDLESWYPGIVSVQADSEEERAELIRGIHHELASPAGEHARDVVASWCSPLRRARVARDVPSRQHETQKSIRAVDRREGRSRGLPVAPPLAAPVLAASSEWRSAMGLFAAARAGVVKDETQQRPEPGTDTLEWAILRDEAAPASLLYVPAVESSDNDNVSTMFDSQPGLIQVSRGYVEDMAAVVVGNTGTDFALALAYDRILGRGIWVALEMLEDPDALFSLRSSLGRLTSRLEQYAAHLTVSSSSLGQAAVSSVAEQLQEPNYGFEHSDLKREMVDEPTTVQVRAPRLDSGSTELVLEEHIGTSLIVPMAVLKDGTLEAMTGLESPVPSSLMHPVGSGKVPYWYVDVAFARSATPRSRDLPSSVLLAESKGQFPEVNLRSSREGISFNPSSMGFVSSASLLPGRLGRPRLRVLSMRTWVEGMANISGMGVRVSSPGRQAELVSRRLGSRDAFLDLVSTSKLPLLRAFIPHEKSPKREPGEVVIGLEPYLSFGKMSSLLGSDGAALELVDFLSAARLLRRGLVLRCHDCGRPSFVDADRIGQLYECPQCAASNTLTSERWREGNEPIWYYDLYAPFRDLLRNHGDIPALAAATLRRESRRYVDVPELEFFDLATKKPVAEIDLVASVGDEVVLVEAKVSGAFPSRARGAQTEKLLRVAQALRADRVILATSKPTWNVTDVAHLKREAARSLPFPLRGSEMTNLGID